MHLPALSLSFFRTFLKTASIKLSEERIQSQYAKDFIDIFRKGGYKVKPSAYWQMKNTGRAEDTGTTENDVPKEELKKGIKVESEHLDNKDVQKEIALDHLAEDPKYYTKLLEMEKKSGVVRALTPIALLSDDFTVAAYNYKKRRDLKKKKSPKPKKYKY